MTLKELLDADHERWHTVCHLLERFDKDDLEQPGVNGEWSAKDVMAHIAAWHALTTDRLETLRMTGELTSIPNPDTFVDEFNAKNFEDCKDLTTHDVRNMFDASHHRFLEEVSQLAEPLTERVQQIVASNGHGHYEEHIPQLEAFLGAR